MKWLKRLLLLPVYLLSIAILLIGGVRLVMLIQGKVQIETVEEMALSEGVFSEENQAEAVIVLGAGVYSDGSLSPILENRLKKTVEVYRTGAVESVFVSGDHREGEYDEVDHMVAYLKEHGIPEEDIWFDYDGYSTYESIYRAVNEFKIRHAVIVTQEYHLYRALSIARHYDMQVTGVAADNAGDFAGKAMRELREWPACLKDLYYSITKQQISSFEE